MQIKSATFKMSAKNIQGAPEWDMPEFAFIGRSNVGKSSLINMLSNREGLAKVSATPGKTRLLNFFVINEKWSLVDLPGYGYAKVAKSEKLDFADLVGGYLDQRENLRQVYVLIDSRLTPQAIDLDFINWLGDRGVPFILVFTKADKQSAKKTQATIDAFLESMPEHLKGTAPTIVSSSKEREGRGAILRKIQEALDA